MLKKTAGRLRTAKFLFQNRRRFQDFIASQKQGEAWRTPGNWYQQDLDRYTSMAADVRGDFAEIGVFQGEAFSKLIPIARAQGKHAHAFDSFYGMDDPGEHDWRPKGQFSVGGPQGFQKIMRKYGFAEGDYHLWAGFIPACFQRAPDDMSFSFVLLDVDNYQPTVDSLDWVWKRMPENAILALDDFYPEGDVEASKAIKEFLRRETDFDIVDLVNHQLILRKCSSE